MPNRQRPAGVEVSGSIVSDLAAVPVGQDGPDWGAAGTKLRAEINGEADATLAYTLAIEANDAVTGNEAGWYNLIAATGMPAVHTTRDGSQYVPRLNYASTRMTARRLRAVISWNVDARFAVDIEVD